MPKITLAPRFFSFAVICALATFPNLLRAQPSAHYVPGVEGLTAASLPPPGFYARDYNLFYWSDRLNDSSGHRTGPPNFQAFTYAQVPRVIWITDTKLLGGYVGVDALLPFVYQRVEAGAFDQSTFGMGDFMAESSLSWHADRYDLSAAAALWMPTGEYSSTDPTKPGLGFWTGMLTLGGTYYFDTAKTWSVSALNRYEFNSEQRDTQITPGQVYTVEGGVGKKFAQRYDLGFVGYYQQKVTKDSGAGSTSTRDRVAAIGPEIGVAIPSLKSQVTLRYLDEFIAENRAQGQTVTLTLTKRF